MNTPNHASPRSPARSRLPVVDHVGAAGLGVGVAVLVILGTLGPAGKSAFWLGVQLVVVAAATGLAVSLVVVAAVRIARRRAASMSLAPLVIAAMLAFLAWGILYPSYRAAREEVAAVNEIMGFTRAILSYANHHEGWLPGSLADLIEGGYIQKDAAGNWLVRGGPNEESSVLRDPAWFNVAWGVHRRDIAASGMVEGQQRLVVRPAATGPPPGFESVCQTIAQSLGQHFNSRVP
jgi:hypothetical protein